MASLEESRKKIDAIDKELVSLFEKRMNVVLDVARYKKENKLPVFQGNREEEVLKKAVDNLDDKDYAKEAKEFLNSIMEISRGLQKRKIESQDNNMEFDIKLDNIDLDAKVGFQGVPGAFSEEALIKIFGEDSNRFSYEEFEDVFEAIENDEIKYGVLPIENSSTGAISKVMDLLKKYDFHILAEETIKINQHLMGIKGTKLEDIKEVYSHAQGIEQSSEFLKQYDWKLIPFHNTATSAKFVKDTGDKSKAAIAGIRSAKIYNLEIIEECINTLKDNTTRFVVIGKELVVPKNADKVSVAFTVENKSGKLFNILRYFAENNINMIKIESRPMKDAPWSYLFYVAFEGSIESNEAKKALELIKNSSEYFRLLGAYKNAIE
ncbi:chorismate mutase [Clostridium sp. HCP1S3_B4]|uniref:chorismate mutase n=1 Tax=unclassified Clostridium TaxID=2614128 RepID=UPI003F8C426D